MKQSKRLKAMLTKAPERVAMDLTKAISICKENATAKFNESFEVALNLGVDPKHADQIVRSVVSLPHGTGKEVKVLVFAKDDKVQEALDAGADFAGVDEYVQKIKDGWTDVDVIIATPNLMGTVGKLGRVLGPRGLMPNPKSGTVTMDVAKAVKEVKAGKIDFRTDKNGILHISVGKASFEVQQLEDNIVAFLKKIIALKPSAAKGTYMQKITISSTMGLGYDVDVNSITGKVN